MTMRGTAGHRQRGLTMIELVMFIVVVGIAVVGVLGVISLNTRGSADPIRQKQAMAIAESLMDEIRAARFSWCDVNDPNFLTAKAAADCSLPEGPGQEAGGGLRPFDNVNDYVGAYGVARTYDADVIGTRFPDGYTATVTIRQFGIGPAGSAVPGDASLQIQVTVSYDNSSVMLESYRTRYAPNS